MQNLRTEGSVLLQIYMCDAVRYFEALASSTCHTKACLQRFAAIFLTLELQIQSFSSAKNAIQTKPQHIFCSLIYRMLLKTYILLLLLDQAILIPYSSKYSVINYILYKNPNTYQNDQIHRTRMSGTLCARTLGTPKNKKT